MRNLTYFHPKAIQSQQANLIQVLEMCNAFGQNGVKVNLHIPDGGIAPEEVEMRAREKIGIDSLCFAITTHRPPRTGRFLYYLITLLKNRKGLYFIRNPFLYSILGLFNRDIIYEAHDILRDEEMSRIQKDLIFRNARRPSTKVFICISRALADWYEGHSVPREKIMVLHDGVNPDVFTPEKDAAHYKTLLGLDPSQRYVTYAGSLYKDRKTGLILDAAKSLPYLRFIVVGGDDEQVSEMKEQCASEGIGNVMLTGYLPRKLLREYLWASDFLLMLWSRDVPTIEFCSPLKIFEYMTTKRAIIGHDFPTVREVITDKKDAFLIAPDSADALMESLSHLANNPYPYDMVESAFQKVVGRYTWQERARQIIRRVQGFNG